MQEQTLRRWLLVGILVMSVLLVAQTASAGGCYTLHGTNISVCA